MGEGWGEGKPIAIPKVKMSFNLTSPIPENGVAVPIYATFAGHKMMPFWWAISTNRANPKSRLFEDALE